MRIKILANIKNYLSNKLVKRNLNNSKQKNLQYERNKFGFFSPKKEDK